MMWRNKVRFCTFVILISVWSVTEAEYSSALVDLEPLLDTEASVVKALQKYLETEGKRLEEIRRFKEEYDYIYKSAKKDVDNFLANPINAYLLVKRLTTDWNYVLNLVENSTSKDIIDSVKKREIFPEEDDLDEAASALIRLQNTYLLNTTKLSYGDIDETKGDLQLTASDCYVLGLSAYHEGDFNLSILWMQESLNRLHKNNVQMVNMSDLYYHMAYASYKLGDLKEALKLTIRLIAVDPHHNNARKNLKSLTILIREGTDKKNDASKIMDQKENLKEIELRNKKEINEEDTAETDTDVGLIDEEKYKKLCRGEHLRSPAEESKLSCRYTTSNSKYLLLQPVKEERLSLDPEIVVYHDVIRDRDIELLKEIAGPSLERATVLNPETGRLVFVKYRVSKSGWLTNNDHPRGAYLSLLIEEITGLETDTAEFLQINKYGLGGYYEQHYDFRRPGQFDSFPEFGTGNRMATWLFYLSDVDAGGSTVFPKLNVQVEPIKGSAAFWFNLHKNGKGDFRTAHAACPVLCGTKWVANKWLHEKDQEFRRPCSLNSLE